MFVHFFQVRIEAEFYRRTKRPIRHKRGLLGSGNFVQQLLREEARVASIVREKLYAYGAAVKHLVRFARDAITSPAVGKVASQVKKMHDLMRQLKNTMHNLEPWPQGSHLSFQETVFQVVLVIDDGGLSGRWCGICGLLGLQNPQGKFKMANYSGVNYLQYKESEEEKKWAEKIDRKYLRILMRKDPDKFLAEMTPNPKHNGFCVGLDLNHPHHQNLQKEFQEDIQQICKEKGLHDHPALVKNPAGASKIENTTHPRSFKKRYDKKVVSQQKRSHRRRKPIHP